MPYYSYSELITDSQYIVQCYEQIKDTDLQYMSTNGDHRFDMVFDVLKNHNFNYLMKTFLDEWEVKR